MFYKILKHNRVKYCQRNEQINWKEYKSVNNPYILLSKIIVLN